jgi:NTE family protein
MSDAIDLEQHHALLAPHLRSNFPGIDEKTLRDIQSSVQFVHLGAGDVLMEQGAPGGAAYLTISGRLRVYVKNDAGESRMVRELGHGEITGEISLYTDAPRSATVVAIRGSVVACLDKERFQHLIGRHPQVSVALTKKIIDRLQTQDAKRPLPPPVALTLLPITQGVDTLAFAQRLAVALGQHGRACWVDASRFRSDGGRQCAHRVDASVHQPE